VLDDRLLFCRIVSSTLSHISCFNQELLHLVAKAEELEKEEEAYLEELAVLNRISNTTKDDLFDFTVESAKKRKNHTEYVEMEQDEKKQMKKKHKKDKRKNETPVERYAVFFTAL
jgi:hypothetical protein